MEDSEINKLIAFAKWNRPKILIKSFLEKRSIKRHASLESGFFTERKLNQNNFSSTYDTIKQEGDSAFWRTGRIGTLSAKYLKKHSIIPDINYYNSRTPRR